MSFNLGNRTSIIADEIRLIEGNALVDIRDLVSGTVPTDVYSRGQVDASLGTKADHATTYSITQVDDLLDDKQDAIGPGALDIADADGLQDALDAAALPADKTILFDSFNDANGTIRLNIADGTGGTEPLEHIWSERRGARQTGGQAGRHWTRRPNRSHDGRPPGRPERHRDYARTHGRDRTREHNTRTYRK